MNLTVTSAPHIRSCLLYTSLGGDLARRGDGYLSLHAVEVAAGDDAGGVEGVEMCIRDSSMGVPTRTMTFFGSFAPSPVTVTTFSVIGRPSYTARQME